MNITLKATNLSLTPLIRRYVEAKLRHLVKLAPNLTLARVELEKLSAHRTGQVFRAEATVDAPHKVYRAESAEADLYAAIDTMIPKLINQMEKIKQRKRSRIKTMIRKIKEEVT